MSDSFGEDRERMFGSYRMCASDARVVRMELPMAIDGYATWRFALCGDVADHTGCVKAWPGWKIERIAALVRGRTPFITMKDASSWNSDPDGPLTISTSL